MFTYKSPVLSRGCLCLLTQKATLLNSTLLHFGGIYSLMAMPAKANEILNINWSV